MYADVWMVVPATISWSSCTWSTVSRSLEEGAATAPNAMPGRFDETGSPVNGASGATPSGFNCIVSVAVTVVLLFPTPPSAGFVSLGRSPCEYLIPFHRSMAVAVPPPCGYQLPLANCVSFATRRYTGAVVLSEYVMTSWGWLTSGPPSVTAGLNPIVSTPPPPEPPFAPAPLPSPWGNSRAEMSAVDTGGSSSATTVSTTATPAALLPNRQPRPSSAVMRDAAQPSPSDPMYAAATTAIAITTAIISGRAIGSGFGALTTFVARTEKTGITARTPRCSRRTIHPSQYPHRKRIAHRPTVKSQSC